MTDYLGVDMNKSTQQQPEPAENLDEALTQARRARHEAHRMVSVAVDCGDLAAAERHTEAYLAAAAEEDRAELALIEAYPNPYRSQA